MTVFSADVARFDVETPAPARDRIRLLALAVFALLLLLAGRAVQLAFSGDPLAGPRAAQLHGLPRGDIVDRHGVLLATTVRAYALTAEPHRVANPEQTADRLIAAFPTLDRTTLVRRLSDRSRRLVYLQRGLDEEQRARAQALTLVGVGSVAEHRRSYPQGALAAHALGFTDIDLNPLAGVERGLDEEIRSAGREGRTLRLSLDVRVQYALEAELDAAARAANASGAAAIILDGRSGETLALASWPAFDPNLAGQAPDAARRDRVAGDVHELGSTLKPFTVAMALEEGRARPAEVFDLSQPLLLGDTRIEDQERIVGLVGLRELLTRSSNIGAARLALRLGSERQRAYLERLGLTQASGLELGRDQAPLAPPVRGERDVAGLGIGYGLAATPASLAGAYTVFVNGGARVTPTLQLRDASAVERTPVFSEPVARQVLSYMRAVVTQGTGRAADVPGLAVAGKTGTAEKLADDASYDEQRNFSSFAGVFPANDPRYVIVVALDDTRAGDRGGVVAAPVAGRVLRRIAPMLGLAVEPAAARR
ncbi:MAG: penicillin-binding protein 2 [Hyphomonadaceae bacterium]|nr:penicillin-binding protein 2 [Hyphomonadaceae bacterium]